MTTRAVVRFKRGSDQVVVCRDRHPHPDQIVLNLAELERMVEHAVTEISPGNIAAQWLFIDKLWYAVYLLKRENLGDQLLKLIDEPEEVHQRTEYYLGCHSIGLPEDEVEEQYLYDVTIHEGNWGLAFGKKEGKLKEGVFDKVEWGFSGNLNLAVDSF